MKENIIKDKSFAFALRVVRLCRYLNEAKREFVLSKQLLRSGTAIGALVREANRLRVKQTLSTKWPLLSRNPMKPITGSSLFFSQIIFKK